MDALKSKGQMYDQINLGSIPKSGFDLSYNCKGTGTLGRLYPTRCEEVLPGDKWQGSSQVAVQFEPLAVPMLSNMYIKQETFKVPARILWTNWEKFITGGEKLDYDGVVPSVSLRLIMDKLCHQFYFTDDVQPDRNDYMNVLTMVPNVSGNDEHVVTNTSGVICAPCFDLLNMAHAVALTKDALLRDTYFKSCTDLLKPTLSALDSLRAYLLNLYNNKDAGTSSVFNALNGRFVSLYKRCVMNLPIAPLDGTLYYFNSDIDTWTDSDARSLKKFIKSLTWNDQSGKYDYLSTIYEFSDEALTIFRYFYDAFKPFVGKSSTLDYLGYMKYSFRDMLAGIISSIYSTFSHISDLKDFDDTIEQFLLFGLGDFSPAPLSVLPLRANYMIWYWYYRDQLLETDAFEPVDTDNVSTTELYALIMPRVRCWSKDTFTTALTNTGTGSMVVNVDTPISSYQQNAERLKFANFNSDTIKDYASAKLQDMDLVSYTLTDGTKVELPSRYLLGVQEKGKDVIPTTGFSLDMLNRAQRMQKWLMKALIFGNRPQDALFTHFGVKSSDARLRLPEFLCGDTQMCKLDTVMNNTTTSESVAGDKSGNAYGYQDGNNLNTFCEEHGFIITIMSIMPETEYGFGSKRLLSKLNKFDFAFPEFAQLGMDAVYNSELVRLPFDFSSVSIDSDLKKTLVNVNKGVFGYQGRYYDYKSRNNDLHGDLLDVKDMYTFARNFNVYAGECPNLNYQFVHCHPRTDMFVTDDPSVDLFWFDCHFAQAVERCLPVPSQVF